MNEILSYIKIDDLNKQDCIVNIRNRLINIWKKSGLDLIATNTLIDKLDKLYLNYIKLSDTRKNVMASIELSICTDQKKIRFHKQHLQKKQDF